MVPGFMGGAGVFFLGVRVCKSRCLSRKRHKWAALATLTLDGMQFEKRYTS